MREQRSVHVRVSPLLLMGFAFYGLASLVGLLGLALHAPGGSSGCMGVFFAPGFGIALYFTTRVAVWSRGRLSLFSGGRLRRGVCPEDIPSIWVETDPPRSWNARVTRCLLRRPGHDPTASGTAGSHMWWDIYSTDMGGVSDCLRLVLDLLRASPAIRLDAPDGLRRRLWAAAQDRPIPRVAVRNLRPEELRHRWWRSLTAFELFLPIVVLTGLAPSLVYIRPLNDWPIWAIAVMEVVALSLWAALVRPTVLRRTRWRLELGPDSVALHDDGGVETRIPWADVVAYEPPPPPGGWTPLDEGSWHSMATITGRHATIRCKPFPGWNRVETAIRAAIEGIDRHLEQAETDHYRGDEG